MIRTVHAYSARYFRPILVILEFSPQFFSKNTQISNFMKTRPMDGRVVPCGETEGHDEANSRLFAILRTRIKTRVFLLSYYLTQDFILISFIV